MTEPGFIGQKGLNRKLRQMGPEITAVMKPKMLELGEEVKFHILSDVPVGETGDLARAVHVQTDSRGLSVKVGYWKAGNKKRWLLAGWRAAFVEFGTVKTPAKPFVFPAFNRLRRTLARDIDRTVDKALSKVARNGR